MLASDAQGLGINTADEDADEGADFFFCGGMVKGLA
jgi:hypothetical protein